MDVLDHSCSKLGFGGKMCIDGTAKFEEEIDDSYESGVMSQESGAIEKKIMVFSEIKAINTSLLKKIFPVLSFLFKKTGRDI